MSDVSKVDPAAPQRTAPLATGSLVGGIVSLVTTVLIGSLFGPILGLAAIVTGVMARRQIAASGGLLSGRGLALAGIIVGSVSVLLLVVSIILIATGVVDTQQTSTPR